MRLSQDSLDVLKNAITDRAWSFSVFNEIASGCHRSRDLFVGPNAALPEAIDALIKDCAAADNLEGFIQCLKEKFSNTLIDALDFTILTAAPDAEEVVAAGEGSSRFKEQLIGIVGQLDQPGMHEVASNELIRLLNEASDTEAKTLYLAVLGNLKIDRSPQVVSSLVPVMARALKRLIGEGTRADGLELDLDRTLLSRVDLSGLDLHEADIAFADLRYANFDHAILYRARGYAAKLSNAGFNTANLEEARLHDAVAVKARFHNARMISVFFKGANLGGAEFQQAKLQGAHFDRADLSGARFERANLSNAYFTGAKFDQEAITSISRAVRWESAIFDPDVRAAIEQVR